MRTWVTFDDYVKFTGANHYTADDKQSLEMCCDAVSDWITEMRSDMVPPETVTTADGTFAAYRGMVKPEMRSGSDQSRVHWVALQMVKKWWEKRGNQATSGYAELGFIPSNVDKDVEIALGIGRYQKPVAI